MGRAIAAAKKRGWKPTPYVYASGKKVPLDKIRERLERTPEFRRRQENFRRFGGTITTIALGQQYYDSGEGAVWVWEWSCGEDRFCANINVRSNLYGEELVTAVEFVPTGDYDGYVQFGEIYEYDAGLYFGEPVPPPDEDVSVQIGQDGPRVVKAVASVRRAQGGIGDCYRARLECLRNNFDIGWGQGAREVAWQGRGSLFFCLGWARWGGGYDYLGCVAGGYGFLIGTEFSRQLLNNMSQCRGGCVPG